MNKKISFPIAIIIIVVCAVLTGSIIWRYGLFSEISWQNIPFPKRPAKEVTIATDKTEYEQGEVMKITVKNGLNVPIFYSGGERFWFIEKFEGEEWKNLGYERESAFQLPVLEEGKEICYIRAYERPDLLELKLNSETYHTWNQKICPLYREEEQPFDPELIKAGRYRFGFVYGLSKSSEEPYELVNPKTIYSNEFTIKYESGNNPIIHCGGGSCKCMKEKECEPYGGVYIIPTGEEECSANSDNKMCCCPGV